MIAQIKICTNSAKIEAAQKEQKEADAISQATGKPRTIIEVPESEMDVTDLLMDASLVTLAFVNAKGEISLDYKDKSFLLVYSDEVWETLKKRFS